MYRLGLHYYTGLKTLYLDQHKNKRQNLNKLTTYNKIASHFFTENFSVKTITAKVAVGDFFLAKF